MQTVAIYGSNLMMSAIGALLRERPDLKMQQLTQWAPEAVERLKTAPPAVIFFDLAAAFPDFTISMLQNHPDTRLIGVDLASHKMLVISGVPSQLRTADDLVQLLDSMQYCTELQLKWLL